MSSSASSVPDYLRDEKLTQETRDLISSLPSEKGWLVSQIYQFQGRWHTEALLQGILTCQKHFEAKDSDIILVTNPKSGTTWLKSLLFALINRHKFPVSSGDHPLLVTNPHLLVPFMEGVYYESPDFDFSLLPFPRLMNTHISHLSLPESVKSSSCKIVYCCRNPKDIFESLSSLEVNRQGKLPNGIEINAFFRKGETGGWRDTLSESLADAIDRTTEEKFGSSGLKFAC
ncbi:hypothetical protein BRARA_I02111 [Brassica rapa]|uniref:Sulfotransferase n=1 Tax=Brassica campestris TaxID=3711 RepID=A0A397XWL2_BRACM|nr:hypothetical protein BRARA_I02111 [Brassica rapa]